MASNDRLTVETMRQLLDYNPTTGLLTWLKRPSAMFKSARSFNSWNAKHAGKPALTSVNSGGYCHGLIFGKTYKAHRVIWALHYGEWPSDQIDHINHDRSDNRVANLRAVNNAQNQRNASRRVDNKSGTVGVFWHLSANKWHAYINSGGVRVCLGFHERRSEAVAARKAAEVRLGFHQNHGR